MVGRAFTLIELVMVLVIVGVVSAIAVPRFGASNQVQRATAAARRLAADLALVQSQANLTSTTQTVSFTVGTGRYTVLGMTDLKTGAGNYTVDLGEHPFDAIVSTVTLGGTTSTSGLATISFNGFGSPSVGGTLTIGARSASRVVVVDGASGKAWLQ